MNKGFSIIRVRGASEIGVVRDLCHEYLDEFSVELTTQNFKTEIDNLPGEYVPPAGDLLLARRHDGEPLGCIGLRPLNAPRACELKRLFVREAARGCGAGRALATAAVELAAVSGYRDVMLETLPSMTPAIATYRALGFEPIPPYWNNTIPDVVYLGKQLQPS